MMRTRLQRECAANRRHGQARPGTGTRAVMLLFGLLALLAQGLVAGTITDEQWYSVHLDGRKIGHMHVSRTVDATMVRTERSLELGLGRNGEALAVLSTERTTETVDGLPLDFESDVNLAGSRNRGRSRVVAGQVEAIADTGDTVTEPYPWPAGALLPEGQRLAALQHPLEAGTRFSLTGFDSVSQRGHQIDWEVLGPAAIDIHGTTESLIAVRQTIDAPEAGPVVEAWIRPDDRQLRRLRVPALGIKLEMLACDRDCALAPNQPTDVLSAALVAAPRALGRRERGTPLRYRLHNVDLAQAQAMHGLPGQQVEQDADGHVLLTVDPTGSASAPPTALDLKPTRWLQSDADEIRKLAQRAIGRYKDPRLQMQRLEQGVRRHIAVKSLRIGYASALETYHLREGDCTEHALLLAAMARAVGIPARVATGLAYAAAFGEQRDVFVPHAWVFAWIDGRWQGFDAALPGHDSGHLAFSSDHGDPFRFYRGVELLGLLQITAVEPASLPQASAAP
jgi:hypothetical protein